MPDGNPTAAHDTPAAIDGTSCSRWTQAHDVRPIGTAGSYAGFVLIEWPLPWPRDVSDIEELHAVVADAAAAHLRVQLMVPDGDDAARLVSVFRWAPEAGRHSSREASVPAHRVVPTATRLIADAGAGNPGWPGTTLLVCTHGRRDRCCGSLGTRLWSALTEAGLSPDVRIRRTSHTGGHRFAPTVLVLPEGTSWGFVDVALTRAIVDRSAAAASLAPHYRGCTGLDSAEAQALEGAVLAAAGWAVLDGPRIVSQVAGEAGTYEVHLDAGEPHAWRARVEPGRRMPVPVCGEDIAAARKSEDELLVTGLRPLPTTPAGTP